MMIRLQSRTFLPLGENNQCVNNFVEFAQVEDTAKVHGSLVYETFGIRRD